MPKSRLDSWKAIAEYLERSLRTVQRWHASHGLPVHHFGGSKGSVFAYAEEIDQWLVGLSQDMRTGPLDEDAELELRKRRSLDLTASAGEMWEARSERNIQTISGLYRQAIDEDAGNLAAFTGLANTMIFGATHGVMDGTVAYPRALEALSRLPQLEAEDLDARCASAWLGLLYERNWRQARDGFDEVLSKRPWSSFAMSGLSLLHIAEGRVSEATECAWEAWKRNPLACSLGALLCWVNYLSGDYEQALDLVQQVRASGGCGVMTASAEVFASLQTGAAAASLGRLESVACEYPQGQTVQVILGYAYAVSGETSKAWEIFHTLEQMSELKKRNNGYALALVLVGLNRKREAIPWLEAAYAEGSIWSLGFRSDPILRPLSGDSRFDMLLQKIGSASGEGPQIRPSGLQGRFSTGIISRAV